jgi:DNA polymerase-3 subunit alpha
LTAVNRRVIENLIKCGAFDSTGVSRARMTAALDEAMRAGQALQRDQQSSQIDIFAMLGTPVKTGRRAGDLYPQAQEWTAQESLAFEKEALGFYITGHPLDKYDRMIKKIAGPTIAALKEKSTVGDVKMAGVVSALKLRNTKKGERYASFNLEDKTGFLEMIAWPDVYRKCAELLASEEPIFIKGRLEVGEERLQVIANDISSLAEVTQKARANGKTNGNRDNLHLYARESEVSAEDFVCLRDTLLDFPGACTVFLHLVADSKVETVIELPEQVRVAPSPELEESISKLLGSRIAFHPVES